MKLTTLTLAAALAAPIFAWNLSPLGLLSPYYVVPSPSTLLREQQALADRVFGLQSFPTTASKPRYEITNTEEQFQVALDVPGVRIEDITVSIEDEGQVLAIRGRREASGDNYKFASKFSQSFLLDPTVDIDSFKANINDGVLIVTAPKNVKQIEETKRTIPVTQLPEATTVPVTQLKEGTADAPPVTGVEGEKDSTPVEKETVTTEV
jgi:HSP20 family protein